MASSDLQSEIIGLIAYERGLASEKVRLSDGLLQDLGMDGDDAVDFFNSLHARYGTDLTHLHESWADHFGPEGLSSWFGLLIILAAIIGGLTAAFLGLSGIWVVIIAVSLLAALIWTMRAIGPPDRTVPITVDEVVSAVESGAWPRRPHI